MGGNATPIIDQEELDHGAEPWVVGYHRHLANGGAPLTSAPDRLRRLTVEECAVLQSFPVGFQFKGPRVAQYRQVGNAVPPRLAYAVAAALLPLVARAPLPLAA
jgi:DNA (cytosine-5)-methyltransferase 1